MQRYKKRFLFLGLFFILSGLGYILFTIIYKPEILPLGKGRFVTFFYRWSDVDACGREFQIRGRFGRLINDGCFVEFCGEPEQYKDEVISTKDSTIIGILDHQLANPIFIMCDLSTNQCFPCNTSEQEEQYMRERLNSDNTILP